MSKLDLTFFILQKCGAIVRPRGTVVLIGHLKEKKSAGLGSVVNILGTNIEAGEAKCQASTFIRTKIEMWRLDELVGQFITHCAWF